MNLAHFAHSAALDVGREMSPAISTDSNLRVEIFEALLGATTEAGPVILRKRGSGSGSSSRWLTPSRRRRTGLRMFRVEVPIENALHEGIEQGELCAGLGVAWRARLATSKPVVSMILTYCTRMVAWLHV